MEFSKFCNLVFNVFEYIFGIDKGVSIDVGLDFGEIIITRLFSWAPFFRSQFSSTIDMAEINTVGSIQSTLMIIMISASTTAE